MDGMIVCDNDSRQCRVEQQSKQASVKQVHWDRAYTNSALEQCGWYQSYPEPSLRLIEKINLPRSSRILNVGAGTSKLIDELIKLNYNNLIINDISSIALSKLRVRLGAESANFQWIVDDLVNPTQLQKLAKVDLWHDRAVLHFFISARDQRKYFNLLKRKVKRGGYVIIASFNLDGATKCSGLPVYRYDEKLLQLKLGSEFKLVEHFNYNFFMPSGDSRPYVYTLFQREK